MQETRERTAAEKQSVPPPLKPAATPKRMPTVPKELHVSLTLGIAGTDVRGETFDKLENFLQIKARMTIMAFERGDMYHIRAMFTITTSRKRRDVKCTSYTEHLNTQTSRAKPCVKPPLDIDDEDDTKDGYADDQNDPNHPNNDDENGVTSPDHDNQAPMNKRMTTRNRWKSTTTKGTRLHKSGIAYLCTTSCCRYQLKFKSSEWHANTAVNHARFLQMTVIRSVMSTVEAALDSWTMY
ncbi:hypothetical protein R1sor_003906 [Riccia sorocarpa]|uniref:Uncharacterized protein n=1 Tax=Riccia sorocarpa TaxID=122646 RepID=A0ABD3H6X1_9MARC